MSRTYLGEVYEIIRAENPLLPVVALGIFRLEKSGDETGSQQRRSQFASNYGDTELLKLDTCLLFLRMYGVPGEVSCAPR